MAMNPRLEGNIGGHDVISRQRFTPDQMQLFQDLFSHVGPQSATSRLASGDPSQFAEMEAPALRQFQGELGNIASRFSQAGTLGSRRSSGFKQQATSAAQNFAESLASKRQGLQRQALSDLFSMSQNLLGQNPYETYFVKPAMEEEETPWWQSLLQGGLPLAGMGIGALAGGPFGASLGGQLGGAFANAFSGRESQPINWKNLSGLSKSWKSG